MNTSLQALARSRLQAARLAAAAADIERRELERLRLADTLKRFLGHHGISCRPTYERCTVEGITFLAREVEGRMEFGIADMCPQCGGERVSLLDPADFLLAVGQWLEGARGCHACAETIS